MPLSRQQARDRGLLRRAVLINFAGLLGRGFWPLLLWLVSSWYGAATLGQFTLLYAPVEVLLALCSTGFVDGIYRNLPRLPGEPIDAAGFASVHLALRHVVGLGLALVALAYLGGGWLVHSLWGRAELTTALTVMALAIPLGGAVAVLVATATAMMRNEGEALIKGALVPGLTLLLASTEAARTRGVEGLAWAYVIAQLCGVIAAPQLRQRREAREHAERGGADRARIDARAQRRFGLLQGVNVMLWVGVYSIDTLLLGVFVGDAEVARYRAGSELARLLQYARTQVSSAFAPLAARYLARGQREELQRFLGTLSTTLARAALLLAGVIGWLGEPVLRAMLGAAAPTEPAFLAALLLGHVVVAAFALAGNTLVVAAKQRAILLTSLTMTALNLGLGVLLIPRWGLLGAAAATAAAMAVAMAAQVAVLRSTLGLTLSWRPLLAASALAAAAHALAALLVRASAPWTATLPAWAGAALGAGVFAAAFTGGLAASARLRPRS